MLRAARRTTKTSLITYRGNNRLIASGLSCFPKHSSVFASKLLFSSSTNNNQNEEKYEIMDSVSEFESSDLLSSEDLAKLWGKYQDIPQEKRTAELCVFILEFGRQLGPEKVLIVLKHLRNIIDTSAKDKDDLFLSDFFVLFAACDKDAAGERICFDILRSLGRLSLEFEQSLIESDVERYDLKDLLYTFEKMKSVLTPEVADFIGEKILCRSVKECDNESAAEIFRDMLSNRTVLSQSVCAAILRQASQMEQFEKVLVVYEKMKKDGIVPNYQIFSSVAYSLSKLKPCVGETSNVLPDLKKFKIHVNKTLSRDLAVAFGPSNIESMLEQYRLLLVPLTSESYHEIFSVWMTESGSDVGKALQFATILSQQGIRLNNETLELLLKTSANSKTPRVNLRAMLGILRNTDVRGNLRNILAHCKRILKLQKKIRNRSLQISPEKLQETLQPLLKKKHLAELVTQLIEDLAIHQQLYRDHLISSEKLLEDKNIFFNQDQEQRIRKTIQEATEKNAIERDSFFNRAFYRMANFFRSKLNMNSQVLKGNGAH